MNEYQAAIDQLKHDKGWCPPSIEKHYILAIAALKEKAARENPEALTLEQLRKMGGEPVFYHWSGGGICDEGWAIVAISDDGGVLFVSYRGKWIAWRMIEDGYKVYAHKPGGEVPRDKG